MPDFRTAPPAGLEPVIVEAVLLNGQGDLPRIVAGMAPPPEQIAGLEEFLAAREAVQPRDRKFLDRQMLILTHLSHMFMSRWPDLDRDHIPVHLGLGPARTDLAALLRWGARIEPGTSLPMVQPAGAVGLLPNTPLSWLSLALHLRGEGAVWAGFIESGATALGQASALVAAGAPEALAIAVDCPDSYFVPSVLSQSGKNRDSSLPMPVPPETAVALRLRRPVTTDSTPARSSRHGGLQTVIRAITASPAGVSTADAVAQAVSLTPANDGYTPRIIDGEDLQSSLGHVQTALLPAGVALATTGAFGTGLIAVSACDFWKSRHTALIEVLDA